MDKRSIEKHLRKWRIRGKTNADRTIADPSTEKTPGGRVHSPTTGGGLPIEDQIRKVWDPRKGGLPTFVRVAGRGD